jgi:dnaJ-class molecular chaperone with C-terminal Zn finger domain
MKMSAEQAYKILAVPQSADIKAIKKKYRKLMLKVHPDSLKSGKNTYQYSAQEINEAYSIIIKNLSDNKMSGYFNNSSDDNYSSEYTYYEEYYQDYNTYASDGGNWDVPVNDNVYTSRAVIKAQLAYLLAQQYIDATYTLNELITPVKQNNAQIFYIDSMLEMPANAPFLRAGMTLYPQSLKNHRLYLKTKSGNAAGYISFRDDRLYYIIIPLLEQKRAQVKVQIAARQDKNNTRHNVKYKNLDFWIRISDNNSGTFPESINMQIEEILTKYSKM